MEYHSSVQCTQGTWYNYHYPSTTDLQSKGTLKSNGTANLVVNGTLNIKSGASFGGIVQTETTTGMISMNGTNNATASIGHIGQANAIVNKQAGKTERTLTAQLYSLNGAIPMASGKVYKAVDTNAHTPESYSYKLYADSSNTSTTITETQELNATISGTWICGDTHSYGAWTTTTAPTCTAAGVETRTCTDCGYSETQPVEAIGHTEVTDAAVAPDCDTTGLTAGIHCSVCGTTITAQTEVAALGHAWGTGSVTTAATCGSPGVMTYTCTRDGCGQTREEEIFATGSHTEEIIPATNATCTSTGLTEGKKCSICGQVIQAQEEIPMIAHTEEILAAVAATCTQSGLTEGKRCSTCGTTIVAQETIPALGHTEVTVSGTEPTCTENGLTDGKQCSVCGETTQAQETIPAYGHTWSAGKCTVCGASSENLCDHAEKDSVVTAPTCTAKGYTTHTCKACGCSVIGSLILKGIITNNFSFKFTEDIMSKIDTAQCLFWDDATYAQLEADGTPFSESNATLNQELVKDNADGYLKAGYDKTAVKNLGDTLYVCAVVTTMDGNTYRSGVISYSGHAYISNKVGSTDADLVDLVKDLTVYSDNAKTHFASQK